MSRAARMTTCVQHALCSNRAFGSTSCAGRPNSVPASPTELDNLQAEHVHHWGHYSAELRSMFGSCKARQC